MVLKPVGIEDDGSFTGRAKTWLDETYEVPDASTTVKGRVELATNSEAQALSDSGRALTPAALASVTATTTRTGIAEIATNTEVLALSDSGRIVTPSGLAALLSALPDSGRGFLFGDTSRDYRVVAGVIRNSGSGWDFIDDSGHRPTGLSSVTQDSTSITIAHSFTGTRVAGLVVCPDEALAGLIHVGTSVGLDETVLTLRKQDQMCDYLSYDGSDWQSLRGLMTVTGYSGSGFVVEHDNVFTQQYGGMSLNVQITGRGGASQSYIYKVSADGIAVDSVSVEVRSAGGVKVTTPNDNMRFFVDRGPYMRVLDPDDVNTTTYPGSNIWIFGLLEV